MAVIDGDEVTRLPGNSPRDSTPTSTGDTTLGGADTAPPAGDSTGPTIAPPHTAAPPTRTTVTKRVGAVLSPGEAFGPRYHIIKLLGQGGMGAVYQAWDQELGVAVALKVIRPEASADPTAAAEMERRFKRELLLARQVTHTNVVRIHDLGDLDGIKYISMPYIKGEDLSTRLRREKKLPVPEALKIARQVAAGLAAAHQAGIVHRDLKPANIMIDEEGHVLIMDFGIARAERTHEARSRIAAASSVAVPDSSDTTIGVEAAAATMAATVGAKIANEIASLASITQGGVIGTVAYMAPEQAMGLAVDQRADVYAFGMIVSEMLIGRPRPREDETPIEALKRRTTEPPVSMRQTDPSIPDAFDAVVLRCLQPKREARFQATADLVTALDRLDDRGRLLPVIRRLTPRMIAAASVLVIAMVAGTWYFSRGSGVAPVHPAMSVLIGDFENATGDAGLETTLEQSIGIALEGASFINEYPRDQAAKIAAELGSKRGVDEPTARLIAVREGLNAIVFGRIESRGSGYRLTVRSIDPQGKELGEATATASAKRDVLTAVSQVASKIRDQFGDTTPASARQADAETFTTASLVAIGEYAQGQELAVAGRDEEAIAHYRLAVQDDPKFGRAYSGLAVSQFKLGRSDEAAASYKQAFSVLDRMTEREKLRTLGAYYLQFTKSYDKAIDNYSELVKRYPADRAGHVNLGTSYFSVLNFSKAMDEGRQALQLLPQGSPQSAVYRSNYALYAMYAGDFALAAAQARQVIAVDPKFHKGYLPTAIAALDAADADGARKAYANMAATTPAGQSLAEAGLADVDLFVGRPADAEKRLRAAIADDTRGRRTQASIAKQAALTDALLDQERTAQARAAAAALAASSEGLNARVPAARALLRSGDEPGARTIADALAASIQPQDRAYAKIVEAEIALQHHRASDAVDALLAARKFIDLWLGRYDLGIAYVEAKAYPEAVSELELADKRRGEATAMFLDDWPTAREFAALPYWLGRAHEGLGSPAASKDYATFLARRTSAADPLVADARKRLH